MALLQNFKIRTSINLGKRLQYACILKIYAHIFWFMINFLLALASEYWLFAKKKTESDRISKEKANQKDIGNINNFQTLTTGNETKCCASYSSNIYMFLISHFS